MLLAVVCKPNKNLDGFAKLLCDFLYYQNDMCKVLIGRAIALRTNYKRYCKELQPPREVVDSNDLFLAYLCANGKLCKFIRYCKNTICNQLIVINLNTIFEIVKRIINLTNEVLVATYGTSNDNQI